MNQALSFFLLVFLLLMPTNPLIAGEGHGHDGHGHNTAHDAGNNAGNETGHPAHEAAHGDILFPKEQQSVVDFAVQQPEFREIAPLVTVTGELAAISNAECVISAPLAGLISVDRPMPYLGQRVKKGDDLAHIEPPILQEGGIDQLTAQIAGFRNRVTLAQKELDRARRLFAGKAAPAKRVEEAEIMLKTAQAALAPLTKAMKRLPSMNQHGHIVLVAPMSGAVTEVNTPNGTYVQAGQPLLRIVDSSKLWLKANIPVTESGRLEHLASAFFTITGIDQEFQPSRLVTVSDIVDPRTRTVQALLEVDNPDAVLKIGMFANVFLNAGQDENAMFVPLSVPLSAIFEDESKHFVYVQVSGESFTRREVTLGRQDRQFAAVLFDRSRLPHRRYLG